MRKNFIDRNKIEKKYLAIEHSKKLNHGQQYNPETVHKLMADQISREYALLNVLPNELADAHMSGKIHIHDLDYYSTRPAGFSHDLRFFLKNGLKPDGLGDYTATSSPAKKPEVAFLHAAKVLAAAQTNCSSGQVTLMPCSIASGSSASALPAVQRQIRSTQCLRSSVVTGSWCGSQNVL